MKRLKEILSGAEIEEILLGFMLLTMLVICTMQVIWRYVLESALSWSEELARYIFVWLVWVAAAYATKKMRHLRITFLQERCPQDKQWIFDLFALAAMIVFAVIFGIYAVKVVYIIFRTGQRSPAMQMPMWIAYLSVPVGIILLGFRAVENVVLLLKEVRRRKDEWDL